MPFNMPYPGNNIEWYEVRFKIYHYNSGAGDNGTFLHKKSFNSLDSALGFKQDIELLIEPRGETGKSRKFCEDYCYDGFLVSVLGIWECIERKVW